MRTRDPGETIKSATCAAGCGAPWKKWHRDCNLVFCEAHVDAASHQCSPPNIRMFPEEKKTVRKRRSKVVPVPAADLFPAQGNGH